MQMETSVSELRAIADCLFSHLEKSGNSRIKIPYDYYWHLSAPERYDIASSAAEPVVGQISDDLSNLRKMCEGGDPIAYGLAWFGSILEAVGDTVVR